MRSWRSRTDRRLCAAGSGSQCRCYVRFCLRGVLEQPRYPVPPCFPGVPPPTPVVLGVVVVTVVGDEDGGGGSAAPAGGAGAGAACGAGTGSGTAGVGSLATVALAVLVGGVVMAGREGGAVVGTAVVSGLAGRSSSLRTAIIDPKPTRNAATHASGSTTARPPILAKKERPPSSSSAASIGPGWVSSSGRGSPSLRGAQLDRPAHRRPRSARPGRSPRPRARHRSGWFVISPRSNSRDRRGR